MKKTYYILVFLLLSWNAFAQTSDNNTTLPATQPEKKYPEIKGYVGIVHPLYTFSKDGNQPNFRDYYIVGNPWGINIWKSPKFGISFEFTPFIKFDNNTSKLNNFVFHPGVCYRLGHDFTFVFRAAYETSGRYGFTPILNKVFIRGKQANFFAAILGPVRFGNDHAPSLTASFQFGVGF
ncbi:MAG: hypothetical protein ACTHJT_10800 [Cytophaga sp.]|uniref:hypothetical protein n=1 Tax=Cytophaga sp. TaxID=29535 RepID=UPI003F7ED504